MERKQLERYKNKKIIVVLSNEFWYKVDIQDFYEDSFECTDKDGTQLTIRYDSIAYVKEIPLAK